MLFYQATLRNLGLSLKSSFFGSEYEQNFNGRKKAPIFWYINQAAYLYRGCFVKKYFIGHLFLKLVTGELLRGIKFLLFSSGLKRKRSDGKLQTKAIIPCRIFYNAHLAISKCMFFGRIFFKSEHSNITCVVFELLHSDRVIGVLN